MRRSTALLLVILLLALPRVAAAQESPDPGPPADGGDGGGGGFDLGGFLGPLLGPLNEIRLTVGNWKADFNEQMNLWLEQAVTYVGDRIWEAVGQRAESLLAEVTTTNDFTRVLSEIPAAWTYENPVVWTLWALVTGCFLAFLGPQLAGVLALFLRKRRRGAPWGDLFDDCFDTALGVGGALSSPVWVTLTILVVNVMAALIVQDSAVLPGMPRFTSPDEAARNAGLLLLYAVMAFLLMVERIGSVAVVMACLVFSGWGLGSFFWPHFGAWYKVWRGLAITSFASCLLQNVLFRLGGETINRVLAVAPETSREGTFLGLTLGLTCLGLCLLAPMLVAGAYAMGALPRTLGTLNRGGGLGGLNVGRTLTSAVAGATAGRAAGAATAARAAAQRPPQPQLQMFTHTHEHGHLSGRP